MHDKLPSSCIFNIFWSGFILNWALQLHSVHIFPQHLYVWNSEFSPDFPLLLHISEERVFCFRVPDVLKENLCLKFSWYVTLLSWHLSNDSNGLSFPDEIFLLPDSPENLFKYLVCSPFFFFLPWCIVCESFVLNNGVTQYLGWTFSNHFRHTWVVAQKLVAS